MVFFPDFTSSIYVLRCSEVAMSRAYCGTTIADSAHLYKPVSQKTQQFQGAKCTVAAMCLPVRIASVWASTPHLIDQKSIDGLLFTGNEKGAPAPSIFGIIALESGS